MIKRLQIKFICVIMGFLLIMFSVVLLSLNLYMDRLNARQADSILKMVAEYDGLSFMPKTRPSFEDVPPRGDTRINFLRIFYVKTDHSGNAFDVNYDMMFDFTREEAIDVSKCLLKFHLLDAQKLNRKGEFD